jgi:hypothetical protein
VTGPEHYREAERLLREEVFIEPGIGTVERDFDVTVAAAHVHATLALAAAAALGRSAIESRAWADVAGAKLSDS